MAYRVHLLIFLKKYSYILNDTSNATDSVIAIISKTVRAIQLILSPFIRDLMIQVLM